MNKNYNYFIAGFIAGEGCFSRQFRENNRLSEFQFNIDLHKGIKKYYLK